MKRAEFDGRMPQDSKADTLDELQTLFRISGVDLDEVPALLEAIVKDSPNVLLLGETGTGKTALAGVIHGLCAKRRAPGPVIVRNLATVPPNLAESELFGHVQGAFTGAERERTGLIEEAHKGVLFLDEVGHANPELQAKLLTVIESRSVCKIGDTIENTKCVDVLWIGATSRLDRVIPELAHRLGEFVLTLSPLRGDEERIEHLAEWLLRVETTVALKRGAAGEFGRDETMVVERRFSEGALSVLRRLPWPGNVRQLRSVIKRVVMLAPKTPDPISNDVLRRAMSFGVPSDRGESSFELSLRDLVMKTDLAELPSMDDVKRFVLAATWARCGTKGLALETLKLSDSKIFIRLGVLRPSGGTGEPF